MVSTPKLRKETRINGRFYKYYAGYSSAFVQDVLTSLEIKEDWLILDPWNGSGTTTSVCSSFGYAALGYDLNPAMVIVAKARLLDCSVAGSLESLCADVVEKMHDMVRELPDETDCLEEWLAPRSARSFRALDKAIRKLLVDPKDYNHFFVPEVVNQVSSLAALFYVAAFRALRKILHPFMSSNPTWIKSAEKHTRLRPSNDVIVGCFKGEVQQLKKMLEQRETSAFDTPKARIALGDSRILPLKDGLVDVILTSPPYCTRIDYVVATKPELALIGLGDDARIKELRHRMIGTPTVTGVDLEEENTWAPSCNVFLRKVRRHRSKASDTYYLKYFLGYFDSMFRSLQELHRVCKEEALAWLVVQDSYYKDVHNDLPLIVEEMSQEIGWKKERLSTSPYLGRNKCRCTKIPRRFCRERSGPCSKKVLIALARRCITLQRSSVSF